jgi:hypothetical protein
LGNSANSVPTRDPLTVRGSLSREGLNPFLHNVEIPGERGLESLLMDESSILVIGVSVFFAATMYIRVELDFKRNAFRVAGHSLSSILVLLATLYSISILSLVVLLEWLVFCSIFLFINEVIRIYLRKHSMKDILENHPTLYWLTRGKIRRKMQEEPA